MLKKYIEQYVRHVASFKDYYLVGFFLLGVFFILSYLVHKNVLRDFDFDTSVRIQNNVPLRLDDFLSSFSIIGSFELTLALLIFLSVWRFRKNLLSLLLIPAFGVMHVIEIFGKAFLDQPNTPFMFHRYSLDIVFPSSYVQPGGAYPSGHSMRSTYIILLFIFLVWNSKMNKSLKIGFTILLLIFLAVMLISRVSLGEHWATDVIGGALLAAAFAMFSFFLL